MQRVGVGQSRVVRNQRWGNRHKAFLGSRRGNRIGAPDADGVVEVAYSVAPEHQGKGYATETAKALVSYAFSSGKVRTVRAHTLPETNASGRVLSKCGFRRVGEVIDPDDGLVWRWERDRTTS
jgi:[ribosomal protein S5]-alanine N-acetyltransferase